MRLLKDLKYMPRVIATEKLWRRCLDHEPSSQHTTSPSAASDSTSNYGTSAFPDACHAALSIQLRFLAARRRYSTEFRMTELLMRQIIAKE